MKTEKLYTTTQAATMLNLSPSTVLRAVKDKQLKAGHTPGGHFRIPESAIEAFRRQLMGTVRVVLSAVLSLSLVLPARAEVVNQEPAPVIEVRKHRDAGWCWVWGGAAVAASLIMTDLAERKAQEANNRLDRALFEVDYLAAREQGRAMQTKADRMRSRANIAGALGIAFLTAGAVSAAVKDDAVYVRRDIRFGGDR